MAALTPNSNPVQPTSAPLPPDLEPDDEWKQTLKLNIEAGLRSMVDEAKQKLNTELAKTLVSPEERERLTADHLATLKTIRQLAEEQFRIALERERQERRWASGEQLDRAWSESMMKEQQAILDRIEKERKNKLHPDISLRPLPPPPPALLPAPPPPSPQTKPDLLPESVTPTPRKERVTRTPTQILDPERDEPPDEIPSFRSTRKVRAGSVTSTGSWNPSIPDDKPLKPIDDPDPIRRESIRRKPSMTTRPIVQEFWKPSITPEEDAQMSRTFTLARRSSTASSTSYKAPSVLSTTFSDPLDALVDRERASIHAADQEWSSIDRARERVVYDAQVASASPPNSAMYTRGDTARVHAPPPSASRPIAPKRSFTADDFPLPSPSRWAARSPYDARWESRSPDEGRSWQSTSSQLRGRFSTQDMRQYFQEGRSVRHPREEFEEDGLEDVFETRSWRSRDFNERRIQDIEDGLRKREEAANRREEELARKVEELKREDDGRKKRAEEQRREEAHRRLEEEARQREDEEAEEELRRKEEEADRREREAAMRQEEARKKEEEAKRKEEEAKKKEKEARTREMETKRKEEEVKKKEKEARTREMEARRKEEEVRRKEDEIRMMEEEARRKEYEARRKQEEAERKEEEARRRTEEISMKAEETRKKEEELHAREEGLRRREEELNRREAEMRRREDDLAQEEFRKREEEIRRQRAEDRKKQEVWETWPQETLRPTSSPQSSAGPWPIPNRNERTTSPPVSVRNNPVSGWSSASTRPTSTQPSSTPKPPAPTTPTAKAPTTPNTPLSEAEFHRRQAEQAHQREEQFRREQARLALQEHERQSKAGKTMSKEEVSKLFEAHRGQWDKLSTLGSLIWEDFPWPMLKRPKGAEDLTSAGITAYMLSPVHPQDRGTKERIKDNIRRWHPDRFNAQFLFKVKESERERVSEGAGSVARILNDLLRMQQDT